MWCRLQYVMEAVAACVSITVCIHQVTDKPAEAIDERRLAPWERGASLAEGSLHARGCGCPPACALTKRAVLAQRQSRRLRGPRGALRTCIHAHGGSRVRVSPGAG